MTKRAFLSVCALLALTGPWSCYSSESGGPIHVKYMGARYQAAGPTIAANPNQVVKVGQTDDGRDVYQMPGGGGGPGAGAIYVTTAPNQYRALTLEDIPPSNRTIK